MKKFYLLLILLMILFIGENNDFKTSVVYNDIKLSVATDAGFNDENFYSCVVEYYNKKNNASLTVDDLLTYEQFSTIDELICKNNGVSDITGIEKLTNLTSLNLMENNLSNVDLTKNNKLMYVELSGNPRITSIDLSKNIDLKEIYFRNDSLKNINLSSNTNLENLDLGFNELTSINLNNNINLKYVVLSSNQLSNVDISNNTKLIEFSASNNKIESVKLPGTDTLEKLDLHNNKISSIDVSKYTKLQKLVMSTNQLSTIDLSNNIYLKELYISSNNLQSLDLSKLSNLNYLNAVLNKFDNLNIPTPQNIIDLVVESDWIKSYDFSKFSKLNSIRVVDYYVIPIYGTKFDVSSLANYKSSNVNYIDSVLYSDFNKRDNEYINSSSTIKGKLGSKLEYTLCSTNIENNHNTCGNDLENKDNFQVDNNVTINELNNFSNIIFYEGYREFRFMTLSSDVYVIDDNNNIIDVSGDDDSTILNNLKVSFDDAVINIANDKLQVYYNNILLKEYALLRTDNPGTGNLGLYLIGIILIISFGFIVYFISKKKDVNNV